MRALSLCLGIYGCNGDVHSSTNVWIEVLRDTPFTVQAVVKRSIYPIRIRPDITDNVVVPRYPKQQRLLALKKAAVAVHALPPTFLPYSELSSLQGSKFDVILIDPPFSSSFTWDHLQDLPIPALSADPSFVLLWVGSGSGEGLERGREVMAKWGFRRCEDIVWVKTNKTSNKGPGVSSSALSRTAMLMTRSDRPTDDISTHTDEAALPDGHPRHGPSINRQLVRPL